MVLIFDTHPIQYRSPVFAKLQGLRPNTKVIYFSEHFDGSKWWFHEIGKTPSQNFGVELRKGFANEVLEAGSLPRRVRKLNALLNEQSPSAVVVFGYYLVEHWVVRILCAWKKIPLVFVGETFTEGPASIRRLLKRFLRQYFFSGIHRFITIGNKTRAYYRKLGITESKLVPAKYCVDPDFFRLPAEQAICSRKKWRQRWEIPQGAFVVLFVGRLFERKRPQDLVRIHQQLDLPDLYTVGVGSGELEPVLRAQAIAGLQWTGFQNQQEIRDAYYGADVLVVPSEYETWGLVVNEAALCGLPAVVTDTCGVADDLTCSGETGFIYPMGDTQKASDCVSLLYHSRSLGKRLGEAVRAKAENEYGSLQFAQALATATDIMPEEEFLPNKSPRLPNPL